jgi:hypothetical protein
VLEDRTVPSTFLVTNTNDSGTGSLRQAILNANAANTGTAGNPDLIQFAILASDPHHFYYKNDGVAGQITLANVATTTATNDTAISDIDPDWAHSWWSIQPASPLPRLTDIAVIDGYSQGQNTPQAASPNTLNVGDNAVLRVELNGNNAIGGLSLGLSGGSTIKGLVINRVFTAVSPGNGNQIQGNFLGTDVSGTAVASPGNLPYVLAVYGSANTIGGTTPAARNIIATNGITLGGGGNMVQGNYIGTNAAGTAALAGMGPPMAQTFNPLGIAVVAGNNTIEGNLISGNPGVAVVTAPVAVQGAPETSNITIQGNFIGTDATGKKPIPNGWGIILSPGNNDVIAGNTIAFNNGAGVSVQAGTGNRIEGNSIYANGGYNGRLGIDLNQDGVGTNAANDAANHVGANNLMNFPALTAAFNSGTGATISGTLSTGTANGQPFLPNATITLDFYANTTPDPTGYGQGQYYLGSSTVTTNASGNVTFTASLSTPIPAGAGYISATATDAAGNTSEFCADIPVAPTSGGPYTISEGDSLRLYAAAASTSPLTYSWDINGDGVFDVTGSNQIVVPWATLNALGVDGPHTYTMQVQAKDGQGNVVLSLTAPLTVKNTPPTPAITTTLPTDASGNPTSPEGTSITLGSSVTDPSAVDTAAGFNYAWTVRKHAATTGQAPSLTPVSQYATKVVGYSSQLSDLSNSNYYNNADNSAAQALGQPNAEGYSVNHDLNGWAPAPPSAIPEFLTVGFDTPVYATGVTIWENGRNGFVTEVDVLDVSDQYHTVWTGNDSTPPGSEATFLATWAQTGYLVKGVRIYVKNDDPNNPPEIDAVQLSGKFDPSANGGRSDQYATTVIGPSSPTPNVLSNSENSTDSWSTGQAFGEPDVPVYRDDPQGWAPFWLDGAQVTLALGFAIPVYADGVTIRENQGNGFVTQIELLDTANVYHTVWAGVDPSQPGALADFRVSWPETAYQVQGIRITVNTDHQLDRLEEIDSVQLHGWFTPATLFATGTTPNLIFTPDDNGTYVVTLTATDKDGGAGIATQVIDVTNVPPTAHITQPTVNASGQVNFTFTASDPSTADQAAGFSYAINWGDSTSTSIAATANNGAGIQAPQPHGYAPGAYTVTVTATDKDGGVSTAATALVVISNTAQDHISLSGGSTAGQISVTAGSTTTTASPSELVLVAGTGGSDTYNVTFGSTLTTPIALAGSGTDTVNVYGSADPNTANYITKNTTAANTITWGPTAAQPVETVKYSGISATNIYGGQGSNFITDPGTQTTIYAGPRQNTITITATSGSGVVINGGPSTSTNTYIINMGNLLGPVTINSTAGTCTVTVNGPAGSNVLTLTATQLTGTGQTINFNLGSTATKFTVSGGTGNNNQLVVQGTPPGPLAAQNLAPTVGGITAPLAPTAVNVAIAASAGFTNLDGNPQTAVWNWGDLTTSPGSVSQTGTTGTVTGSHSYSTDGVFTITLTVTDSKGGGAATASFKYEVVYNPNAGFVTGGGWINSPAGAYPANPALTGKANFGFDAKYQSGSTVPTGSTQFQFPAANLTFQSTSYDWLVITTNQGQYQGSGTINGAGNYGFLVTALDNGGSTPDKLRLKIWDKNNNNAVVYDTQPGASTTAAPTTALGGGRIQVHTNAQLVAGGANPSGENVAPLTVEELQPVVQEAIARWAAAGIDAGQLSVLRQVTVGIAAFPDPWLGMAFPGAIWIDQTAAGYGWYLAPTPADDSAFPAAPGSPAYGKVDLLTVVEHELGHELGFEDTTGDDLMGVFLAPGVRRVPTLDQAPVNTPDAGFVPPAISPSLATLPARGTVVGSEVLAALLEAPLDKGGAVSTVAFAPPTEASPLPSLAPVLLTVESNRGDGAAPTSSGQQEANLVWALDTVFASNQDLLVTELA